MGSQATIQPDFKSFAEAYKKGASQLVWCVLPADMETPVSAYRALEEEGYSALFESVIGGDTRGRYSIICLKPDIIWRCKGNHAEINRQAHLHPKAFEVEEMHPFESLRLLLKESECEIPAALPPMAAGVYGFMGYDMVRLMEDLPEPKKDPIGIPDSVFFRPKLLLIFDHVKDELILVSPCYYQSGNDAKEVWDRAQARINSCVQKLNAARTAQRYVMKKPTDSKAEDYLFGAKVKAYTTREQYHAMVKKAREYIVAGDIFQVVPSQRFEAACPYPPLALYRSLRHLNPSPFLFLMRCGDFSLVGSSPEILVRLREGEVTIRPIAGTRKRGKTRAEDLALEKDLLSDQKEISEHLMLLDLGRNDVGRVAKPGSVKVTEQMIVERYSHVMHIVSNVTGDIDRKQDALDALIGGFPAGTVSGAPKIRAMEIIHELEPVKRTFYGGGIGYISAGGDMDTCIALRTGLVKDGKLYVQAGGGVVAESDPEAEYQESCNKASALLKALADIGNYLD